MLKAGEVAAHDDQVELLLVLDVEVGDGLAVGAFDHEADRLALVRPRPWSVSSDRV